jgi:hypothetical protein
MMMEDDPMKKQKYIDDKMMIENDTMNMDMIIEVDINSVWIVN